MNETKEDRGDSAGTAEASGTARREGSRLARIRCGGFTLTELMATMALSGILMTVAVPNLGPFIKDRRITTATNDFVHAVTRARTEAVKRRTGIIMCRAGDPNDLGDAGFDPECQGNVYPDDEANQQDDWTHGWLLYATPFGYQPTNTLPDFYNSSRDDLVAIGTRVPDGVRILSNGAGNNWLIYYADGSLNEGGAAQYAICDERGASKGRLVTIPLSGRPQVGPTTTCNPS